MLSARPIVPLATLAASLLLATSAGAQTADTRGELTLASRTERQISGRFDHEGRVVSFLGRTETPGHAMVRVEVDALRLETWVDFEQQRARTDGHGGVVTLQDRQALAALYERMRGGLVAAPGATASQKEPPHEALLLRRIAYWSEAPVGTTLGAREFGPPSARFAPQRPAPGGGGHTAAAALACQMPDENGIAYFNCNVSPQVECHDASHCFTCASRPAGRYAADCPGECGPGCNGLNIYTWDCLDHDYCCRIHGGCLNPWDSECGDEFFEADDDFLWGWPNC
jgi:hypothetical protein